MHDVIISLSLMCRFGTTAGSITLHHNGADAFVKIIKFQGVADGKKGQVYLT